MWIKKETGFEGSALQFRLTERKAMNTNQRKLMQTKRLVMPGISVRHYDRYVIMLFNPAEVV